MCLDPNICLDCGDYKYIHDKVCYSCSAKCVTCNSATNCTACDAGYLVSTDLSCKRLSVQNCVQYRPDLSCITCDQDYIKSADGLSCTLNLSCNDTNNCTSCKMGYYLKDSQCLRCPAIPNCLYCDQVS